MKRKSFGASKCAVARSLDEIGDWWTLLILRDAFDGIRRFSEFQKNLGIPKSRLTLRLKALVDAHIMATVPMPGGGRYREYVLTDKGKGLFPVMVGLRQWGEENLFPEGDAPGMRLVDRVRGRPINKLELRAQNGRLLGADDTLLVHTI